MRCSYFSRDVSDQLKGIALVLMFVHHFFTFPDWITCGINYSWIQNFAIQFCAPTDICVCLFAFLNGYFYYFSKGTISYSLRKITDFLLSYWLTCIPLMLLAVLTGCYTLSKTGVLSELMGLQNTVMSFCWYVNFFCIILLLLPILARKQSQSPMMDLLILLVIPTVALNLWQALDMNAVRSAVAWNLRQWYPCVAVGYLFAKYELFTRWFDGFAGESRTPRTYVRGLVCAVLVWAAFRGRYYIQGINLGSVTFRGGEFLIMLTEDVLFAPMFLYGGANLLRMAKNTVVANLLGKIGKRSMFMWFYHCIFFNCCKSYTQIVLYFPRNPVLVLVNGLILCYAAAVLTEPVQRALILQKDRLCRWVAGRIPVSLGK